MKILTVLGARPQFIKAAAFSNALDSLHDSSVTEVLVHTGQHYDETMSGVFFSELGLRAPAYNLGISGCTHGAMTGRMLEAVEKVLISEQPDWVLVYGDTNSTLATVLAACKLHIPIAHVEAGLRSFNMKMPEEVNRVVADHLSSLLLCPTQSAVDNLKREGILNGVYFVGDVMYDLALRFAKISERKSSILSNIGIVPKHYVLVTCHRAENTDNQANLSGILNALARISRYKKVVFPVHPRTHAKIQQYGLQGVLDGIKLIDPVSYIDMVALEKNAELIITDSGGVQKEAFFYKVPCITIRKETEWTETVDAGWNVLAGSDTKLILESVSSTKYQKLDISPYGSGDASMRILDLLLKTDQLFLT